MESYHLRCPRCHAEIEVESGLLEDTRFGALYCTGRDIGENPSVLHARTRMVTVEGGAHHMGTLTRARMRFSRRKTRA